MTLSNNAFESDAVQPTIDIGLEVITRSHGRLEDGEERLAELHWYEPHGIGRKQIRWLLSEASVI